MPSHEPFFALPTNILQTLWTSSEAEPSGGESGAATTETKEAGDAASSAAPAEAEKAAE